MGYQQCMPAALPVNSHDVVYYSSPPDSEGSLSEATHTVTPKKLMARKHKSHTIRSSLLQ